MLTRIVVIRDGRIAMDGPRDAVLAALQGRAQGVAAPVAALARGANTP
jgi:hypothetical protein